MIKKTLITLSVFTTLLFVPLSIFLISDVNNENGNKFDGVYSLLKEEDSSALEQGQSCILINEENEDEKLFIWEARIYKYDNSMVNDYILLFNGQDGETFNPFEDNSFLSIGSSYEFNWPIGSGVKDNVLYEYHCIGGILTLI